MSSSIAWLCQVVGGEHDLYVDESTEQAVSVSSVTVHPLYDSYTVTNDICLLRLARPLNASPEVQPVKLPVQGQPFQPGLATVSGNT